MLRSRSENTRGVVNRKGGENDGLNVNSPIAKQDTTTHSIDPSTTPLLKDKDVNQRSVHSYGPNTTKSNEKERTSASSTPLKSPASQKGYKLKVFHDKENAGTPITETSLSLRKQINLIPTKRSGLNLDVSSPVSKRVETESPSTKPIERAYLKEEELPYIPDVDIDFSPFNDRLNFGAYDTKPITSAEEEDETPIKILDTIDECNSLFESNDASPVDILNSEEATKASTLIEATETVEYGPPKEEELPYVPEVDLDVSVFLEFPNIAAYEYKHQDQESTTLIAINDEDETISRKAISNAYVSKRSKDQVEDNSDDDDNDTEEFELLTDTEQDPFIPVMETDKAENDPESRTLLFADHLFDVDAYTNNNNNQ